MRRREERLPPSGAGLMRYFSEEGSGIKVSPKAVVGFSVGSILLVFLLHLMA
ncbi:MAG: preprotein translocase subunit Sec61beta [Hadesarchaea archaeon]|jgi:preprotein translocase subunit Sec61beta|nr:MAG: preprotein translocase subunit Sec61beta [Hadesarchaea archaeon]